MCYCLTYISEFPPREQIFMINRQEINFLIINFLLTFLILIKCTHLIFIFFHFIIKKFKN